MCDLSPARRQPDTDRPQSGAVPSLPRLDPERAVLLGKIGASVTHSRHDSRRITERARDTAFQKFLDEVDPDRALPEEERLRRAKHAQKAHMTRLILKRHDARRKREAEEAATAAA